ncbi:MAG: MFS transporter [Bacteroidota bacterium]
MPTSRTLFIRLSVMMFMNYFTWGAFWVTMNTYFIQTLGFSGKQAGWMMGTQAIAALISPMLVGVIADRYFAAQKVLMACHAIAGTSMLLITTFDQFLPIYVCMVVFFMATVPCVGLTTTITFRHVSNPGRDFPRIRLWGTFSWVVSGVFLSAMHLEAHRAQFWMAGGMSFLLCLFALTLPDTPPESEPIRLRFADIFGIDALRLFKDKQFAIIMLIMTLLCIPRVFYHGFANVNFNDVGWANAAGKMSGGQLLELFFLLIFPWFYKRFGVKQTILFAIIGWSVRYIALAFGDPGANQWLWWFGILIHGFCFVFYFLSLQIYVDRKAGPANRNAAQGLVTLITMGLGSLVGSFIAGGVVDRFTIDGVFNWQSIWLFPAAFAGGLAVFTLIFWNPIRVRE